MIVLRPRNQTQTEPRRKSKISVTSAKTIRQKPSLSIDSHSLNQQSSQRCLTRNGSVTKRKKYIEVYSSGQPNHYNYAKNQYEQLSSRQVDLVNTLKKYLQKTGVSTSYRSQYSAQPCDTPINKLYQRDQMSQMQEEKMQNFRANKKISHNVFFSEQIEGVRHPLRGKMKIYSTILG